MKDSVFALDQVFDLLPDGVVVVDENGLIALTNVALSQILGYSQAELLGRPLSMLVPQRYRARHQPMVARYSRDEQSTPMSNRPVLLALHKSGEEIPVSISVASFELSARRYSVAMIRDASPIQDQLGKAIARAESDPLTGLGNRSCLSQHMQKLLQATCPFGILFLDLTKFKPFNDQYGHAMGDDVLRLVAKRLKALVRVDDVAARLGGDEFVVLLDGLTAASDLQARAEAVAHSLGRPFHLHRTTARIGVNVGGALYPRDGECESDLIAVADRNMYRAKRAARTCCIDSAVDSFV